MHTLPPVRRVGMPLFPVPRGTRESAARGYFTKQGPRQFVHVHDHATFVKHYPTFKKKNPTVRHKYIFEGDILPASAIIRILERRQRNLLNSMTTVRVSPRPLRRSSRTKTPSVRIGRPASVLKRRRPKKAPPPPVRGKQRRIRAATRRAPFI